MVRAHEHDDPEVDFLRIALQRRQAFFGLNVLIVDQHSGGSAHRLPSKGRRRAVPDRDAAGAEWTCRTEDEQPYHCHRSGGGGPEGPRKRLGRFAGHPDDGALEDLNRVQPPSHRAMRWQRGCAPSSVWIFSRRPPPLRVSANARLLDPQRGGRCPRSIVRSCPSLPRSDWPKVGNGPQTCACDRGRPQNGAGFRPIALDGPAYGRLTTNGSSPNECRILRKVAIPQVIDASIVFGAQKGRYSAGIWRWGTAWRRPHG